MSEQLAGKFSNRVKTLFIRMLLIISVAVLLFSCFMLGKQLLVYAENEKMYESLQDTYYQYNEETMLTAQSDSQVTLNDIVNENASLADDDNKHESVQKEVSPFFNPILNINDHTVGWIRIPHTVIDYPVVQGEDNVFYLNHSFKMEKNSAGSLFMDFRNSIDQLDQNTIIYGHHMKDGSMFKDLIKYRNKEFVLQNPVIFFDSLYLTMKWEIFAVFVTNTSFNYIKTNFSEKSEFQEFIQTIEEKSIFPTDIEITEEDRILTLSTCVYDFDDARLVVMARLLD